MIVVIPIHNQSRNLAIILSEYLNQTVMPDSIILVCDRCTDSSATIAATFTFKFLEKKCILHIIDTDGSLIRGFGAGRTRDVGIQHAIKQGYEGPFLFSDGDCIPSRELVAHHKSQLMVDSPRITCGLRYETLPEDESPVFPVLEDKVFGMKVQDDLRLNAEWCKNLVFGAGYDRLVLNPQIFERSWICWSCNLGMNMAAIKACLYVNGITNGDQNRVFNSDFDGRWGGEDGFVGLTIHRIGGEVLALYGKSFVTHIWHKRSHTNQEHLAMVARKDAHLSSLCADGTIMTDSTVLVGLRRFTKEAFDLGFLESSDSITGSRLLEHVASLYKEQFIPEAIKLLLAGNIKYVGGLPSLKFKGTRAELGRKCEWARSMMPWLGIAVEGVNITKAYELIPYRSNK